MKSLSFKGKILCTVLTSSIILALVTSGIALYELRSVNKLSNEAFRKSLFTDFDNQAKAQVQLANSLLQRVYDQQLKAGKSLDEAKLAGADLLRNLKFGKDGYIWADTPEGVNVVYLGKASEGKNRFDAKDAKGKLLFHEINKVAMEPDGGYTDYWFPKPGADTPFPKRSYSLYFKPFNWVLGTGNYVDELDAVVAKSATESNKSMRRAIMISVSCTIAILIIISMVSTFITSRLLRHIGAEPEHLEDIAELVANGDLTVKMETGKTGIYDAMRRMVVELRETINVVGRSSQEVSASAVELHANADNTANGSNEVVSQAETVATAAEEMAATSADIANNCHRAAESSCQASNSAMEGAAIVKSTVDGMNRIAEKVRSSAAVVEQLGTRSDQIGAIVATIEDIADQTNLLALNAAIEAARAGEQGRGFAVVADEVRALAERTTKATREIGEMIKGIQNETRQAVVAMEAGVSEVEQGTMEAARSGQALENILDQINEVTGQVNQIATAAEEQTATTREISNNIHSISDTVQMSARSAQEISLASSQLSHLSVDLQELVQRFKL
jgi:methyl-accepting chemotaxis protein